MQISAQDVKDLRGRTGAGVMACKRALGKADGDSDKAAELLRAEGLVKAEGKMDREALEGTIGHYSHTGSRLGAMVEISSETDFVAKTGEFQQLAHDLAMQVAGMNPKFISRDQVPESLKEQEWSAHYTHAQTEGKSEADSKKWADQRLNRFITEVCLLDQPYTKDDSQTVSELIREHISKFGENIVVRRFARFITGGEPSICNGDESAPMQGK